MCGLGRRRGEGQGCVGSGVLEEIEVKVLSARTLNVSNTLIPACRLSPFAGHGHTCLT